MSGWLLIIAVMLAAIPLAWAGRLAAQQVTGNAPRWRDMGLSVAWGYVIGALIILYLLYTYYLALTAERTPVDSYFFFRNAVHGFVIFAVAAWLFRLLGRHVGTEGTKKLFRTMPVTAAFGILMILIYAIVSIFAGVIAPYGQEEVLASANVVPGGNPAVGGDPEFPLGTDQIGRDILSRLIYGAQNTVGIAFVTTLLAFFIGGSLGFLAAVLQGWLDQVISRAVDVLMAIPALIFALLLMTIATVWANEFGINRTYFMVIIIAVIDSTRVFRLARAVGLNIVVMDYIEAAKLRGEGLSYLIFKEILPNATAP
ncbi:MAG: ABC transporter permease, partial [Pseudomonadota bacterium]